MCIFCNTLTRDSRIESFITSNPEVVAKWKSDSIKSGEPIGDDDNKIYFLVHLAQVAAKEMRQIIAHDNKVSQNKSHKVPLANYDPSEDWKASSPIVKIFINELMPEAQSDLFRVTFKNIIFLGNQKRNYPFKPQSCYFTSCIIKYLHDKQKILDFLSSIGIGVGDDAINNLEKSQIDEFNIAFWDIPSSSTVMAVMDNNQTDFGTKIYVPISIPRGRKST